MIISILEDLDGIVVGNGLTSTAKSEKRIGIGGIPAGLAYIWGGEQKTSFHKCGYSVCHLRD